MKNKYLLMLSLVSSFAMAQKSISFENNEGYTTGNIHGQNNWEVTLNSDELPINGQNITSESASAGSNALKIAVDVDEDFGWFPIYGAAKILDQGFNYKHTTIEFDAYISELDGSTFEFGTYGADNDEFVPISTFSFNYTGNLEVVSSIDYDYEATEFTWQADKWYKLKAEISENQIKYYIDGTLVYTGTNFSKRNVLGIIFLHDNISGFAYIDNIKINDEVMSVNDVKKDNIKLYPNPVKDVLKIDIPNNETITNICIYNVAGQKVKTFSLPKEINIESLPKGNYIIEITTDKDKKYTSKFIKQ
ncbi:T9SS type A sorting domain-containing protein [Epilithonimonas hominis]|uniref:Por secretion system C-terminal sorting domain-containing protein n=1 Tax=Epilithonimonas hominis TaxID=420404 RepID=A0A1H6IZG3_9FLAO|nr:T9SS type A sorting domain-containing protein [Epilithonimonas hominis]SEH53187.1 Por secretion system C-terminal sorting domain-containing protein [Epilithonimonas hominis]